jgi:hypothetical protein
MGANLTAAVHLAPDVNSKIYCIKNGLCPKHTHIKTRRYNFFFFCPTEIECVECHQINLEKEEEYIGEKKKFEEKRE